MQIAESTTRTGRDGRTIDTTNIGRRAAEPEPEPAEPKPVPTIKRKHPRVVEQEREPELSPRWTCTVKPAPEPPVGDSASRGIELIPPARGNGNGKPGPWKLRWNDPGGEPLEMEAAETEQATEKIAADLRAVLKLEWAIADGIDPADLDAEADGDE